MPRYRFDWANVDSDIVAEITDMWDLEGQAPLDWLRAHYGARPKDRFVADCWPALRDGWLTRSNDARAAVVDALRSWSLGDTSIDVAPKSGQVEYLQTCRNQTTLRRVVLSEFIPLGETDTDPIKPIAATADSVEASDTAPPAPDIYDPLPPESRDLQEALRQTLLEASGKATLLADADGDFRIAAGSATVFAGIRLGEPVVRLFAPVLTNVAESPALIEKVNDINRCFPLVNAQWDGRSLTLSIDLVAEPYVSEHVRFALDRLSGVADDLDDELRYQFGGRTLLSGSSASD